MLRVVAKLALRNSFKIQEIHEALKFSLIDAAADELRRQGEKLTLSRLTVMTGIHRMEAARLLEERQPGEHKTPVCAKVLARWRQTESYRTKSGAPRVLTVEGADSEFAQLVREVSQDLSPYTVLFELERTRAVERTKRGLKLQDAAYLVKDQEAALRMVASDTEDLLETVMENVFEEPLAPNLHLKTQYDNIPTCYEGVIREWFLKEGAKLQKKAQSFLAALDRDENKDQCEFSGRLRAALNTFSRIEIESKGQIK
jgi:hypothetical protein